MTQKKDVKYEFPEEISNKVRFISITCYYVFTLKRNAYEMF